MGEKRINISWLKNTFDYNSLAITLKRDLLLKGIYSGLLSQISAPGKCLFCMLQTDKMLLIIAKTKYLSGSPMRAVSKDMQISIGTLHTIFKINNIERRQCSWHNHHKWKWWVTKINKAVRSLWIVKQWRRKIIERDKKCTECGAINNLHADHIHPLALLIKSHWITKSTEAKMHKEFWSLENWRTLCIDCHKKTKSWGFNF